MEANRQQSKRRVNVEVPADLEAVYANLAVITHSASEIIIDFCRLLPNAPKSKVYARVLMTPMNAKLLHQALGQNLEKYEAQYGEIKTPKADYDVNRSMGFRRE